VAELHVELVSVDRKVWSGDASMVIARTVDGEIGILPGHADHLSVLAEGGIVDIRHGGERTQAAVDGGFLLVHQDDVRILAEVAELADEIDVEAARSELQQAQSAAADDEGARVTRLRAEARLRAAGQSV
jgi:F-type H+-transporting ATPase subunit epsilon